MLELYHLSHFFEFLTGIYFGGFAILNFLQKDATKGFEKNVVNRNLDAVNAKTQVKEYFKIHVTIDNGPEKAKSNAIEYSKWCKKETKVECVLNSTNATILDIVSQDGYFIKRYFPAFFLTGLFCLTIILFSGFTETNPIRACQNAVNLLFAYFCLSTSLFLIWSLFIFPSKVTSHNYLSLTIVNIIIVITLFFISFIFDLLGLSFGLADLFLPGNCHWLILICLVISLIPMLYIFFLAIVMIFQWYWANTFYLKTLEKMKRKNPISREIQKLNRELEEFVSKPKNQG